MLYLYIYFKEVLPFNKFNNNNNNNNNNSLRVGNMFNILTICSKEGFYRLYIIHGTKVHVPPGLEHVVVVMCPCT